MTVAGVECRGVTARYNGRPILRGVDLEVAAGEWLAVIGPNGAGKTTLVRAIAGTIRSGGAIRISGQPLENLRRRDVAKRVAVLPQQPVIPEGMAVLDYVLLGRTPYLPYLGSESPDDVSKALNVLSRLGIDDLAGRAMTKLSGGERQRALLARALAQDASVLLLDEPTTSLDLGRQQQVLELVDELRTENHLAVLSAIHDLTLAGQYADRLVVLADGAVVAAGLPEEVLTPELVTRFFAADVAIDRDAEGRLRVHPQRRGLGGDR